MIEAAFGNFEENGSRERCNRCGARTVAWRFADLCGDRHERICDKCHGAVHIEAGAIITPKIGGLENKLTESIAELIEKVSLDVRGDAELKRDNLRVQIENLEAAFNDDNILSGLFREHLATLPYQPNEIQKFDTFHSWRGDLRAEWTDLKEQLVSLEDSLADNQLVRDRAHTTLMQLFDSAAQDAGLRKSPPCELLEEPFTNGPDTQAAPEGWMKLSDLRPSSWERPPEELLCPEDGKGIRIANWAQIYGDIAEWLVRLDLIKYEDCPIYVGRGKKYAIHTEPIQHHGKPFGNQRKLSNGLYLDTAESAGRLVDYTRRLLKKYGKDPAEFFVRV